MKRFALLFALAACGDSESQADKIVSHCDALCAKLAGCDSSPYAQYCGSCAQLHQLSACNDEVENWLVCLDKAEDACTIDSSTCAAETDDLNACTGGSTP